jgi:predicted dehydrogenase
LPDFFQKENTMMDKELSRRAFLAVTTTTAAGFAFPARCNDAKVVPRKISPNEKLNIAGIGCGGQGKSDVMNCRKENVVALCDVDPRRAGEVFAFYEKAPKFTDYRRMLDKVKDIDAVTVTTPDHTHAPAAYRAMKMGKHVYVQKPMTHTIAEARLLTKTAREMGVATQMGNQGHSGTGARQLCEMVWSDAIGAVREAHIWTNRPSWPQGIAEPLSEQEVRKGLDWDLWIGTAPERAYADGYSPHNWRGWQDFGAGALGDMACHIMDPVFWSLNLIDAEWYTAEVVTVDGKNDQTFPNSSTTKYTFGPRGEMPEVDVYWYEGGNMPPRPAGVPNDQLVGEGTWGGRANGSYMVGDKGIITAGEYGGKPRLLPDEKMTDYTMPDETIPRVKFNNHYRNWIEACKGGEPACSNFDYAGPFTEMVLFGTLALRAGAPIKMNNKTGVVEGVKDSAAFISKPYRTGWEIPV